MNPTPPADSARSRAAVFAERVAHSADVRGALCCAERCRAGHRRRRRRLRPGQRRRARAAGGEIAHQGVQIHRIEGGVFTADRPEPLPYDGRQSTPHGTTVADMHPDAGPARRGSFPPTCSGRRGRARWRW